MEIAALGIAMVYLLVLAGGAIVALLVLVWIFGEAPSEGTTTGGETVEGLPSTDRFEPTSTPPGLVGPERPENEAA